MIQVVNIINSIGQYSVANFQFKQNNPELSEQFQVNKK